MHYSHLPGRAGGRQEVSINDMCAYVGTVLHELAHALGFWHEHSRPDRDSSVDIIWGNIQTGKEHNFGKMRYNQIDSRGVVYDYNSIMHYGPFSFSRNLSLPTIVAKNTSTGHDVISMGQRSHLSVLDIEQTRRVYCCPGGACAENPCVRGLCSGTTHPPFYSCSCFSGWRGATCEDPADACSPLPCANGRCALDTRATSGFECSCDAGYQGRFCDVETDECDASPCLNGGRCLDLLAGFTCECGSGFRGDVCQFLECPAGMVGCRNQHVCIEEDKVCDFYPDCSDQSDEIDCGDCDFQERFCGWQSDGNWNLTMDWNGGSNGHAFVARNGMFSSLLSSNFPASGPNCALHILFRAEDGLANVMYVTIETLQASLEVFKAVGEDLRYSDKWKKVSIIIGRQTDFRVKISARSSDPGLIAINSTLFSDCSPIPQRPLSCQEEVNPCWKGQCFQHGSTYTCQCLPGYSGPNCNIDLDDCSSQPCGTHGSCTDLVDGFSCDCVFGRLGESCQFEAEHYCDLQEGLCVPWSHSPAGQFQWRVWAGKTPSQGTGPAGDHTSDSRYGYYLFIEGSDPQKSGDRAILDAGPFFRSSGECQLSFAYHMEGMTMGGIEVSLILPGITDNVVLWSKEGDQGSLWHTALVPIGERSQFSVRISGVVGSFWESDAALDDLQLGGVCGSLDPCEDVICGTNGHCVSPGTCLCNPGYTGERCELCQSQVCIHGNCRVMRGFASCTCHPGYRGETCSEVDLCYSNPCKNGARCVPRGLDTIDCVCKGNYLGRFCEFRAGEFIIAPGEISVVSSVSSSDSKETIGVDLFTGKTLVDLCENCVNGICMGNTTYRKCVCMECYSGPSCDEKIQSKVGMRICNRIYGDGQKKHSDALSIVGSSFLVVGICLGVLLTLKIGSEIIMFVND